MVAVIVLAVLAATGVLGGSTKTYVSVPVLTPEERFELIQERISNVVYDPASLQSMNSPQQNALQWLATEDTFHQDIVEIDATLQEKLEQRYSLAVFYYALYGATWFSNDGWLDSEREECSWQFISCDDDNRVVAIDTLGSRQNIRGRIPSELQQISSLRKFPTVNVPFLVTMSITSYEISLS